MLYGSGANGKTTLLEVIRDLLGDYGQQAPAETFLERRDSIPNDVARLRGARFVAATETGEGRRLNEALVKRLTGGDTIAARFMRSEWFEFRPRFKAWLATNHRPEVRGVDEAIWRRIRLVPFTVTIPEHERDPLLPAKLRTELPGILALAVNACLDWQKHGLPQAEAVTAATQDTASTATNSAASSTTAAPSTRRRKRKPATSTNDSPTGAKPTASSPSRNKHSAAASPTAAYDGSAPSQPDTGSASKSDTNTRGDG